MRLTFGILVSFVAATLAAALGGIIAVPIGMRLTEGASGRHLPGILFGILALTFGILGFAFSMVWLGKWRHESPESKSWSVPFRR